MAQKIHYKVYTRQDGEKVAVEMTVNMEALLDYMTRSMATDGKGRKTIANGAVVAQITEAV